MTNETLDEVLRTLCRITNLTVSLWDGEYRWCAAFEPQQNTEMRPKNFCRYLHFRKKSSEMCAASDVTGFRRAAAQKEVFSYECPFGLVEAVAPIYQGKLLLGYLMMGQGLPDRPGQAEKVLEKVTAFYPELGSADVFRKYIDQLPRLSADQWDTYLRTLNIFARHIESNDLLFFPKKTLGQLTKDYIRQNYTSKITLADLSMHLHCSTVTLTEHFRREFGMTIFTYLNNKRLGQAERLLTETEMSISEVAEESGFADANYFFRQFKAHRGMSPSAYRKQFKYHV